MCCGLLLFSFEVHRWEGPLQARRGREGFLRKYVSKLSLEGQVALMSAEGSKTAFLLWRNQNYQRIKRMLYRVITMVTVTKMSEPSVVLSIRFIKSAEINNQVGMCKDRYVGRESFFVICHCYYSVTAEK